MCSKVVEIKYKTSYKPLSPAKIRQTPLKQASMLCYNEGKYLIMFIYEERC